MHLRRGLLVLGALGAVAPRALIAQNRLQVIGLLGSDNVRPSPGTVILLETLRERGHIQGKHIRVEDRVTLSGTLDDYASDARALVDAKVDVIVTNGSTATTAASKATTTIPIVMNIGADPIATKFAASLARPGRNITGVTTMSRGLIAKRLELLKELVPGMTRVGAVLSARSSSFQPTLLEIESSAAQLKLQLQVAALRAPEEIEPGVAKLAQAGVSAVYVSGGSVLSTNSERVVKAIARHRLPAVYPNERYIGDWGLMVYAANTRTSWVRTAGYVDRILRGARPAETPIEQMSETELVINLGVARQQGIKFTPSILQRATRAIE